MLRLPKGTPLFENLSTAGLRLDNIIKKLANGCFTGYANVSLSNASGILVFESGKLVSVALETPQGQRSNDFDALSALSGQMLEDSSGTLNVYRLSADLTMCIHALLQGEARYRSQALGLIDIKVLLDKVREEQLNCCMRIYTDDNSVMIFYKDGAPLGFFHNGSQEIESSPGDSQQLAQDPKAKLDLFTTVSADELMAHDLLEVINISSIWQTAEARVKDKTASL